MYQENSNTKMWCWQLPVASEFRVISVGVMSVAKPSMPAHMHSVLTRGCFLEMAEVYNCHSCKSEQT